MVNSEDIMDIITKYATKKQLIRRNPTTPPLYSVVEHMESNVRKRSLEYPEFRKKLLMDWGIMNI